MNTTAFEKIGGVVAECRREGIKVQHIDINKSEENFSVFGDAIIYGMGLIKGVGNSARMIIDEREKNGPFTSLLDFILRTRANKDVIEALILTGAFDAFSSNRAAMIEIVPQYLNILQKMKVQEKKLLEADEAKAIKAQEKVDVLKGDMECLKIDVSISEKHKERLGSEKELAGCYISSHPLDYYEIEDEDVSQISSLSKCKRAAIIGAISDVKLTKRKSDGKAMAFFKLEDRTGIIDACCFTESYSQFASFIEDGNVVKVEGNVTEEKKDNGDEEESVLKIVVKDISSVKEKTEKVYIHISNIVDWAERVHTIASRYRCEGGFSLMLFDESTSEIRQTKLLVSKDILNETSLKGFLAE